MTKFTVISAEEAGPVISNQGKGGGRPVIYPFAEMEVGQGFDAPRDMGKDEEGKDKRQSTIGASARAWAKRHNPEARFRTSRIDENTVRCWRVK